MNATQLNAAAALLNTSDKSVVFAACVNALVQIGYSLESALDTVCGDNSYKTLVSNLYDTLRA